MQTDAESILTAMNVVLDNTSFENTRILREGFSVTTPDGSYSYAGLSLRALGSAVWAPRAAGATEPVLSGEPESAPAAGEPAGAGSEPVASPPKEVTLENLRDVLNLVDGDAETAQGLLKGAIGYVAAMRAEFGTKMKYDLGSRLNVTRSELEGVTKEYSRIVDADYAVEVSAMVRAQLLQRVSIASLQSIFASQRESAAGLLSPARAPGLP